MCIIAVFSFFFIASSCPGGWQQFRSSCYLDSQSSTNKHAAEQNCRKYRSELVTIDSAAENTFIAGLGLKDTPPRTDAILIGLQWTSGGHFRWNDGTSWENSLFKNWPWKPGEPNNGIGNGKSKCATLFIKGSSEGKVVDRNCLESFLFVCEKTAESESFTCTNEPSFDFIYRDRTMFQSNLLSTERYLRRTGPEGGVGVALSNRETRVLRLSFLVSCKCIVVYKQLSTIRKLLVTEWLF